MVIRINFNQLEIYSKHKPRQTRSAVTLGHLWYNLGPHFVGSISTAQLGMTSCQDNQYYPTLGLMSSSPHILTTIQSAHSYRAGPGLSWATRLRGQNELSGQLSDRHVFNLIRSANNGTVLNRHRWNHMSQPTIDFVRPRFTLPHGSFPR